LARVCHDAKSKEERPARSGAAHRRYAIIDLEDGIDMGSFGFDEYEELLKPLLDVHGHHKEEYARVAKLDYQKTSYLRSKAILVLTEECVKEFLDHEEELLSSTYQGGLLEHVPHAGVIKQAKTHGHERVYHHPRKQYAEIAAFEIIEGLLEEFAEALLDVRENGDKASFKSHRMHRLMGDRFAQVTPPLRPIDGALRLCHRNDG
jgi:dGTP triphosphohydrolase